jgi:hypothetical protein
MIDNGRGKNMALAQANDLVDRAMCEVVSQRQLFSQSKERKLKGLVGGSGIEI